MLVERCLVLDAGMVTLGRSRSGAAWRAIVTGPLVGDVLDALLYAWERDGRLVVTAIGTRSGRDLIQTIELTFLALPWGRRRSYFTCGGRFNLPCGRRVLKLYWPGLDPAGFACRHCHRLAYQSTRRPSGARRWERLARTLASISADAGVPYTTLVGPALRELLGGTPQASTRRRSQKRRVSGVYAP